MKNLYYEDELIRNSFNRFMLKRLISYASAYRKTYIRVTLLLISTSLLSLIPAMLDKVIIDRVLPKNGVVPENLVSMSAVLLAIWITLSVGFAISGYFCNRISNMLGNQVICRLREDLFSKLMSLSFEYYDSRPAGKILVRVTSYTDEIADFFINDMTHVLQNVFMMFFSLILVCIIEIRLAAVVILVSIPLAVALWFLARTLQSRVEVDRNKYGNRTAFVAEDITGLEVIKAFNREPLNQEIHDELNREHLKAFMRTTHVREVFFPMSHGAVRIICTIALYAAALFIISRNPGTMTVGSLVTVSTYMTNFSACICTICQRLQYIANMTANVERIFDVLDTEPDVKDRPDARELPEIAGNVSFSHVTFGYRPGEPVLRDLSLDVEAGQMIALVGPTGAGKTTLVSLLDRFYDVEYGSIRVDGIDIRDVTLNSLHRRIGVMMQDTFLFTDTIMENIRFARPDATDEECMDAAQKAFAHDFIMKMKDGYQTRIASMGIELSGGEKQLLSFARLILMDPAIIILDEATSNIDTETEGKIQSMLKSVLRGRTSFVIAHRLSTIQNADRILYIDEQTVVEDGSHRELMEQRGKYYELVRASM